MLFRSAIGVQGGNLFKYHQFRSMTQTYVFDLNKWRLLSMAFGSDITCRIFQEKGKYQVEWIPDAPIETAGTNRSYPLKGVKEITVQGKKKMQYEYTVFSSGAISSQEVLSFHPKKKEKGVSLDLTCPAALIEGPFSPSYKTALQRSQPRSYPEKKD